MKNYWLQKRNKGFPQDDEFSIQQGCCGINCNCSANLDLYYRYQFVQNETVRPSRGQVDESGVYVDFMPTECTPVLAESIAGHVLYDGKLIQTFTMGGDLFFDIWSIGTLEDVRMMAAKLMPGNYIVESDLLHTTGEICTQWSVAPTKKTELVISYEYLYEQ